MLSKEGCLKAIEILRQRLKSIEKKDFYLSIPLNMLPISPRGCNALMTKNLTTVKSVIEYGLDNIHLLKGMGPVTENELTSLFKKILEKKELLNGLSEQQLQITLFT